MIRARHLATFAAVGALAAAPAFAQPTHPSNATRTGLTQHPNATQPLDQNANGQSQNGSNQNGMNENGSNGAQSNQYGANQYGTQNQNSWNGMHAGNYGQSGQWGNSGRASAADGVLTRDTVADVQQHLQRDGFYRQGNIDGIWGPETNQAVMNFQNARGLQPTGTLNLQTLAALGLLNDNGYTENDGPNGNSANGQANNNNYMGNNPDYRSNYSNNNGYSNGNGYQQSANEPNGTNHYASGQQTYSGVHTPFARGGVNSGANAAYDNTNNNGQYNTH